MAMLENLMWILWGGILVGGFVSMAQGLDRTGLSSWIKGVLWFLASWSLFLALIALDYFTKLS